MSKQPLRPGPTDTASTLRSYPAPWKGVLVLACRKCQKKLRHGPAAAEAANIKKALKQRTQPGLRLRVLQVPCLKLCPKGAVAVCTQRQLARGLCSIVRTTADMDALHAECRSEATPGQVAT